MTQKQVDNFRHVTKDQIKRISRAPTTRRFRILEYGSALVAVLDEDKKLVLVDGVGDRTFEQVMSMWTQEFREWVNQHPRAKYKI